MRVFQVEAVIILSLAIQAMRRVFSVEVAIVVVQLIIAIQCDRLVFNTVSKDSMPCTKGAQHADRSCQGMSIHYN
jgi:hypothetical protein